MSINRVVLVGRITKDVELRVTPSGNNVASFTIAVDSYTKDANNNSVSQASFINCVAWNTTAKFLEQYCHKGNLLGVEGRLQSRSYDRKDGTKAYVTEVIVDRCENLTPRDASVKANEPEYSTNESSSANEELSFSDNDLPF